MTFDLLSIRGLEWTVGCSERGREAHAETQVFGVPEVLLNGEAMSVKGDDLAARSVPQRRSQTPRIFHCSSLGADHCGYGCLVGGDSSILELAGLAVRGHPLGACPTLPIGAFDEDVAAETDNKVEMGSGEGLVESLVAESSVGQDDGAHLAGEDLAESLEQLVLIQVASLGERRLRMRLPHQRRGSPMRRDDVQRNRSVVVVFDSV